MKQKDHKKTMAFAI